MNNILDFNFSTNSIHSIGNVIADSDVLAIKKLSNELKSVLVVVTSEINQLNRLARLLPYFCDCAVNVFPDWGILPYDRFSPSPNIVATRLNTLFKLQNSSPSILLVNGSTLLSKVCPIKFLQQQVFSLRIKEKLSLENLKLQLTNAGYILVNQVLACGEFAFRGSIIDIFPLASNKPFRIDLFDDEIDSIRIFDPETQRSQQLVDEIKIFPVHEFLTNQEGIDCFRQNFRERFNSISRELGHIYQQVSRGIFSAGIEFYQPLFFREMATIFDYLPRDSQFITYQGINEANQAFWSQINQRYENLKIDPLRPLLAPNELYLTSEFLNQQIKQFRAIKFRKEEIPEKTNQKNLEVLTLPNLKIEHHLANPSQKLEKFIQEFQGKIIFSTETRGRALRLAEILNKPNLEIVEKVQEISKSESILICPLEKGFILQGKQPCAFISENDLLGAVQQSRKSNKTNLISENIIRNLVELQKDQLVVHLDHGIGRYLGLEVLDNKGIVAEFLVLQYANSKLYVPVNSLNLISRYVGGSEETQLSKLGADSWKNAKEKANQKIFDIASGLLDLQALRVKQEGFAFQIDEKALAQFASGFAFSETADQQLAIEAVLNDMKEPKAMDRLICGDVGFGKTEVAMRASFVAVNNGKQVAMLVPTTLLAEQHFENFSERFALTGVNVAVLSSFKTSKQHKEILEKLASGAIDIVIGTHSLLHNSIKFANLGLVIVDEEHRFGVMQKEQIKKFRVTVDLLTLTATPIPRTLNFALHGLRDLSIIASAPANRLTIQTMVTEYDLAVIKEALIRELNRGGQVYYVHNDITTIEAVVLKLQELVPFARITFGHGQMPKRELERVMHDFYQRRFDVLVCSTIIETGLDVPNANTIIIERADKFGLAQLHQLRGRVGRSNIQAYAYLLTPEKRFLTADAKNRLEAISSIDNLGAGFLLATHDLEIRGAGEILGKEQSGQIASLGFVLYMEMLEKSIKALKQGKTPTLYEIEANQLDIELNISALLPNDFISDVNTRLAFYKKIATAGLDELLEIKAELVDRFGILPKETLNLLELARLRILAQDLQLKKININQKGGFVEFLETAKPDVDKLLKLIMTEPQTYKFNGNYKFAFEKDLQESNKRIEFLENLITHLK